MSSIDLHWLLKTNDWGDTLRAIGRKDKVSWLELVNAAQFSGDMLRTLQLDKVLRQRFPEPPEDVGTRPVRLALLSSSTVDHLTPGLRIAALRRRLWLQTFVGDYGQYMQELSDEGSALYDFKPDTILFAFDAAHLFGSGDPAMTRAEADAVIGAVEARIGRLWSQARNKLGAHVIQQTILPVFPPVAGENEHRAPGSLAAMTAEINGRLRAMADAEGADILALDAACQRLGVAAIHDPMLWHRAKQEISPGAGPLYGDLLVRMLAARQGLSFKCLVLDLDNTCWGGVIGDDGMDGIHLGQGTALGEAYVAFQRYCHSLSRRGVILAVCSKNDEANAREPFESHPEMILRLSDIACFVANWQDKAANIRSIAKRLNIGLDAIVFADDNPAERDIVRRELPMVAVPELSEEPASYAASIADAGYFETIGVTLEDRERTGQYQANAAREQALEASTDLGGYLKSLEMTLSWAPFEPVGLPRIVQLINKSNQFNLTTRRYSEAEARTLIDAPDAITMQLRLADRLGDNGMISVIIGRFEPDDILRIDTWLMSCRVLGRGVERAAMNLLATAAATQGATRIVGEYLPTTKNAMVREHYGNLGFRQISVDEQGNALWQLDLEQFSPFGTYMAAIEGPTGG